MKEQTVFSRCETDAETPGSRKAWQEPVRRLVISLVAAGAAVSVHAPAAGTGGTAEELSSSPEILAAAGDLLAAENCADAGGLQTLCLSGELPPFAFEGDEETAGQMMSRLNDATLPFRAGFLSSGRSAVPENVEEMLRQIAEDMDGEMWDASVRYCYAGNGSSKYMFGAASGACSFACAVQDYVFGEDSPVIRHQNFDAVKPGDAVWLQESPWSSSGRVLIVMDNGRSCGAEDDECRWFRALEGNADGRVAWTEAAVPGTGGYLRCSCVFSRY